MRLPSGDQTGALLVEVEVSVIRALGQVGQAAVHTGDEQVADFRVAGSGRVGDQLPGGGEWQQAELSLFGSPKK